jgi:hypothetical protein
VAAAGGAGRGRSCRACARWWSRAATPRRLPRAEAGPESQRQPGGNDRGVGAGHVGSRRAARGVATSLTNTPPLATGAGPWSSQLASDGRRQRRWRCPLPLAPRRHQPRAWRQRHHAVRRAGMTGAHVCVARTKPVSATRASEPRNGQDAGSIDSSRLTAFLGHE